MAKVEAEERENGGDVAPPPSDPAADAPAPDNPPPDDPPAAQ
jgi:hypothetical protein